MAKKKMNPERKRLIILLLLTMFFMAFILINVTYKAGFVYLVLTMVSLVTIFFWDEIPKKKPKRKMFSFDLRENPRGRFLRVTEDVGGRRDTIIIPATGLEQVREMLDKMIEANEKAGPSSAEG